MPKPSHTYGFNGPLTRPASSLPRLVATLALATGTAVAATVVSIGITRAEEAGSLPADRLIIEQFADHTSGALALAALLGTLFVAACVSAMLATHRGTRRPAPSDHAVRHPPLF